MTEAATGVASFSLPRLQMSVHTMPSFSLPRLQMSVHPMELLVTEGVSGVVGFSNQLSATRRGCVKQGNHFTAKRIFVA